MKRRIAHVLAAAALCFAVGACASHSPSTRIDESSARAGAPPHGWIAACEANSLPKEDCTAPVGAVAAMDDSLRSTLDTVHAHVREELGPQKRDGDGDAWGVGSDCEEYVLRARRALSRQGVPRGALLVVDGWTDKGERHVTLEVRTDKGEYVMDSRFPGVERRHSMDVRVKCLSHLACWRETGA